MKIAVYNTKGEATGRTIELPDEVFGIEPHEHSVWLDVKRYLAAQRQGTHKSKERSEISGSTRKLHRQKGTGGSRKGDINNPLYRGGGRVFGPRPRNYDIQVNAKVRRLARRSALSAKAHTENQGIPRNPARPESGRQKAADSNWQLRQNFIPVVPQPG
jgi:large subunit ribosomal protein L4